jgi:hypothetical protein
MQLRDHCRFPIFFWQLLQSTRICSDEYIRLAQYPDTNYDRDITAFLGENSKEDPSPSCARNPRILPNSAQKEASALMFGGRIFSWMVAYIPYFTLVPERLC